MSQGQDKVPNRVEVRKSVPHAKWTNSNLNPLPSSFCLSCSSCLHLASRRKKKKQANYTRRRARFFSMLLSPSLTMLAGSHQERRSVLSHQERRSAFCFSHNWPLATTARPFPVCLWLLCGCHCHARVILVAYSYNI